MGSEVDEVADHYWAALVQSSPTLATALGLDLNQDEYDDLSPAGLDAQYRLAMDTLDRLDQAMPADDTDRITAAAMRSSLGLEAESHDKGYDLLSLNGIASGVHEIREVYDAMPTETPGQVSTIARRLHATGPARDGWLATQRASIDAGIPAAIRQVDLLVEQITAWTSDGGFFDDYLKRTASRDLPDAVTTALAEGIDAAKRNFRRTAEALSTEIAPLATETDAVGHRPPHAAGTGGVIGWRGVVDAAVVGGSDHALDVPSLLGYLEVSAVQGGDRLVGALLYPDFEGRSAGDLVGGVGVEDGHGLLDARSRADALSCLALQLFDAGELLLSPFVSFSEVDGGADELAGGQSIAVDADGVGFGGQWGNLG